MDKKTGLNQQTKEVTEEQKFVMIEDLQTV